jgi:glutaredoxin
MNPPRLTLYTRRDCHLCEAAHQVLERLRARGAVFDLDIIDVDRDPDLRALYGTEVPVLLVDAKKFAKVRFDERRLARKLGV